MAFDSGVDVFGEEGLGGWGEEGVGEEFVGEFVLVLQREESKLEKVLLGCLKEFSILGVVEGVEFLLDEEFHVSVVSLETRVGYEFIVGPQLLFFEHPRELTPTPMHLVAAMHPLAHHPFHGVA